MNYKEIEILEKAKKVLHSLDKFYNENNIKKIKFENEPLIRGVNKGALHSCWTVVIIEPIFDNYEFLTISDVSGEPLYIQNKHSVFEIFKTADGNYILK